MYFLFMLCLSAADQSLQPFRQKQVPYAIAFAPNDESAKTLMDTLVNYECHTPDKVRISLSSYEPFETDYKIYKILHLKNGMVCCKHFCVGKLRWTLLENWPVDYGNVKNALLTVAQLTDLVMDKKAPNILNQRPLVSASYIVPTTLDLSNKSIITDQDFQKISDDTERLKFVGSRFNMETAQRLGRILSCRKRPLQILNLRDTNLNLEMLQKILPQDTSAGLVNSCWYYAQKLATWSNFVNWSITWQLMPLQLVLPNNNYLRPYQQEFDTMIAHEKENSVDKDYRRHVLAIQVLWDEPPVLKPANDWDWEIISVAKDCLLPNTLKITSDTPPNEIINQILDKRIGLEHLIFYWQTYEQLSNFLIFLSGYNLDHTTSLSILRNHSDSSNFSRKFHTDLEKMLPCAIGKNFGQIIHLNLSGNNGDVPDFIVNLGHLRFLESLTLQRCFGKDVHVRPIQRKSDQLQQLFNFLGNKAWPDLKKLDIRENFLDNQEKILLARAIEESGQDINLNL